MKIEEIIKGTLSAPDWKKKTEAYGGIDFQSSLKKANADLSHLPRTQSSPSSPAEDVPLSETSLCAQGLFFLSPLEDGTFHNQTLQTAERALDMLEVYQKALGDPGTSLKNIDPMIHSLSKEMKNLASLSEKFLPDDPLGKIIHEVEILSATEIQKFKRGDYI
jgi:hypothetical protein